MSTQNKIAIARDHEAFAVLETIRGTLAAPAATDLITPLGLVKMTQQPSFSDSEEVVNSRDTMDRFQDRMPPGDFSFSLYARPSGSLGVAPMASAVYESLMGTKTVNAGVSVVYSQAIEKPSLSLWARYGHTVKFGSGGVITSAKCGLASKGGFRIDFIGKFMQMGIVGTQELSAAIVTNDTTFKPDDASNYDVGGLVEFYDVSAGTVDDNGGAGYEITARDLDTNTLTTSAIGSDFDVDDIVRPFLPTGTETGNALENRKGIGSIDSTTRNVSKFDINISDDVKMLDDEITTTDYPEDYAEMPRKISGQIEMYFRQDDAKYFVDNIQGAEPPLAVTIGDTPGSILEVAMSRCSLGIPDTIDSAPTVGLGMPYTALGTNGEDSCSLTFK